MSEAQIHPLWAKFIQIEQTFNNHVEAALAKMDALATEIAGPRPTMRAIGPIGTQPPAGPEADIAPFVTANKEDTVTSNEPQRIAALNTTVEVAGTPPEPAQESPVESFPSVPEGEATNPPSEA